MIEQLKGLGAPEQVIDAWSEPAAEPEPIEEPFDVWPENWDSVMYFIRLATQWAYSGGMVPVRTGLDYARCEAAARGCGVDWPKAFADLQVMEMAVIRHDEKARG